MDELDFLELGYYASLGLKFDCTLEAIQSAYKRLAREYDPDKVTDVDSATATARYQQITTAYYVLSDATARKGYDRVLQLRYYLHQKVDPELPLFPHLIFSMQKINDKGVSQPRLLKFDFTKSEFTNWDREELRTTFTFDKIKSVGELVVNKPNEFIVNFFDYPRPYHYRAVTIKEKNDVIFILKSILAKNAKYLEDDTSLPWQADQKGYVQKRGSSGVFAKRYAVIGTSNLLIFRKSNCVDLIGACSLTAGETQLKPTPPEDPLLFNLHLPEEFIQFRFENQDEFKGWCDHVTGLFEQRKVPRPRRSTAMPYGKKGGMDEDKENENDASIDPITKFNISLVDTTEEDLHKQLVEVEGLLAAKRKEIAELEAREKEIRKKLGKVLPVMFKKIGENITSIFRNNATESLL